MATSTPNAALILNISGAAPIALKRGEKTTVAVKAGQRYKVVRQDAAADAKDGAAKDVAASQQGQDLLLSYADGTQVVLSNFYEACKAEQCAVDMPGASGTGASGGYVITGDSAVGASLAGGGKLVYAYGDTSALSALTQGAAQASGFTLADGASTYIAPVTSSLSAPLGLGAIAGGLALLQQSSKDTTPPSVHISSDVATLRAGETATITFTFSEDPGSSFAWDGTSGDIVVTGGTLSAISGSGLTRTATFTPSANLASGNASITVASGTYTDAAGNNGGAGTTPGISIDTLAPTLTISSDTSALKAGETATITFTFSEDPGSSFAWNGTSGDILVTGGSLGAIGGSGLTRTATFTPTPNVSNGDASIRVAAAAYTDAAGNTNSVGSIASAISINTALPTLSITSDTDALKAGETATITFTFTEDPGSSFTWNGTAGDIVVTGGTLSALGGSGLTRTATFTPTPNLASGSASITVASGAYTNAAGNNGGAGTTPSISIDTIAPTLSIGSSVATLKAGETATITFTFSEDPGTSFLWDGNGGDVVVTGGSLGAISGAGLTRTATFTPTVNLASGNASITVAAGAYTDAAGNSGGAGTTPSISIDTLAPTVTNTGGVYAPGTVSFSAATSLGNISPNISAWGLALTPDGSRAYVTDYYSNSVSVIDTATNTVTGFIEGFDTAYKAAVSPDGTVAYVVNYGSGRVSVIDTATNTVSGVIALPGSSSPYGVAFSPDGTRAYVTDYGNDAVVMIRTADNTVFSVINSGFVAPYAVAVSPDGSFAYVTNFTVGTISVIDTASNTVVNTISGFGAGSDVAFSPDGALAYVADFDNGTVAVIDTTTHSVTSTISGFDNPMGVAVSPDGTLAYVSNYGGGTVSVIDTTTNTVVNTISDLQYPVGVAVTPTGNDVYVADGKTVSLIDGVASAETLVLTGTNYSTLLETGETAATDIKARLDWSKLTWDIDGDGNNVDTPNVSFVLSDILSANVTDGTHLTIIFTSDKNASLQATTGFAGTTPDSLDIAAGFCTDVAGNVALTDAANYMPLQVL